jgi:hypothetical protein
LAPPPPDAWRALLPKTPVPMSDTDSDAGGRRRGGGPGCGGGGGANAPLRASLRVAEAYRRGCGGCAACPGPLATVAGALNAALSYLIVPFACPVFCCMRSCGEARARRRAGDFDDL